MIAQLRRVAAVILLANCASPTEPRPYSIAGVWEGASVGQGVLHLELARRADIVGGVQGSGFYRVGGQPNVAFTVDGTLRDSLLYLTATRTIPGDGNIQATYRIQESDAGSFTAVAGIAGWSFSGAVARQ
jgi:hypothetical protein